jgi:type III secretory pathway component EscV
MVARVASAGIEACVGLSQEIEDQLRAALVDRPEGAAFAVSPAAARDIVEAVRNGAAGAPLVVGADLRAPLAKLLRAGIPAARVLSYAELERAGFRGTPARQIAALKAG